MNVQSHPSDPSVHYLLSLYDVMGIPHFQRGLVWNDENTSLLLESLYFDTPCGTIVLWEPVEPGKHGVPLSRPEDLRYLVIDGQQRIRSLHNALEPENEQSAMDSLDDEEGEPGDIGPNAPRVWCLNLSRVPELTGFFDAGMSRYPMFRFITDPTTEGARVKYNLVPLRLFFERRDADVRTIIRPTGATSDETLRRMEQICLGDGVRSLREKKVFSLIILRESPGKNHLADVVALYNRINSAGRRIESEEKAFATLVSLHPSTSQWLGEVFEAVHGPPSMPAKDLKRDEVLKRRKERNFGFKLFIRTFIQVCAYHFGHSLGSNSFSFDVVNSLPFQTRLKNDPEMTRRLFDRTSQVVLFVLELLRDGLRCDDLQTLPDTASLLPLFQVLIRFPKFMEPGMKVRAPVLQCLALRLLLSQNPSQETILELVKLVNRAEKANDCLEELDRKIHRPADFQKNLPTWLKDSNTLLDRYVLILYWLLRKREARDFSYENLDEEKREEMKTQYGQEVALEERVEPEKQHIVPYSLLEKLYNIEKRGRVSRHTSNNIGNITYISHRLNSYEKGLGDKPIDLGRESRESAPNNLECHFLAGEVGHAYKKAKKMAMNVNAATRDKARGAFEEFCGRRRELIAEAFVRWVEELGPALMIPERVEPEARVDPSLQDRVRRLDYPNDLEDAVLELVADGRLRFKLSRRKQVSKGELVCTVSSSSDPKGFFIRFLEEQLEVEPAADSALYEALQNLMVDRRVSRAKKGVKDGNWVLRARGEEAANTAGILIEFVRQLSGVKPGGK